MKDIYEAVEKLSASLAFAIERVAGGKGWASKPFSMMAAPQPNRYIMLVSTSIHLPYYRSASFTPRYEPEPSGKAWGIDIRRTDGVARDTWAGGLSVTRTEGKWTIMYGVITLTDEWLDGLLEELGTP
jgi:hypothetical protein